MTQLHDLVASCIVREPIVSHSGLELSWWLDLRRAYKDLDVIARELGVNYPPAIGIETMGWEIAASRRLLAPYGRVTKAGTVYLHEPWRELARVCATLIDDVVTTEASMREALDALEIQGYNIVEYLCVMDRRLPDEKRLEVRSLFVPQDFGLECR